MAPLDGRYTAQLAKELGICRVNLELLEDCLICWVPTPEAPHHEGINRDFLVAFFSQQPGSEGGVFVFLCFSGFSEAVLFSLEGHGDVDYGGCLVVGGNDDKVRLVLLWVARDFLFHKLVAK